MPLQNFCLRGSSVFALHRVKERRALFLGSGFQFEFQSLKVSTHSLVVFELLTGES